MRGQNAWFFQALSAAREVGRRTRPLAIHRLECAPRAGFHGSGNERKELSTHFPLGEEIGRDDVDLSCVQIRAILRVEFYGGHGPTGRKEAVMQRARSLAPECFPAPYDFPRNGKFVTGPERIRPCSR